MFETLRNALKVKDIRKRLLFTLVVLVICRLGSQLPIPGIDTDTISQYLNSLLGDSFNLLNSFTGGSFESMSLFALNVTPYITASIIIQLLTIAIPALEELYRDGEDGRKKINNITRFVTLALSVLESAGLAIGFGKQGLLSNYGPLIVIEMIVCLTAGPFTVELFTVAVTLCPYTLLDSAALTSLIRLFSNGNNTVSCCLPFKETSCR